MSDATDVKQSYQDKCAYRGQGGSYVVTNGERVLQERTDPQSKAVQPKTVKKGGK